MWLSVEQVENHYVSQLMITHFTDVFVSAKWLVCFIRKQRSRDHTHHSCWCTAHGISHCQPSIKPTCTVNNNNPASAGHVCVWDPWWRHPMQTFSALLAICAGNSPVTGEFPAHRPVTQSFDIFFDLRLNKRLSKQSWGWWFETPSCPLWRHCNAEVEHCTCWRSSS